MDSSYIIELDMLRAVIAESPMPIGLYIGRSMTIKMANKAIQQAWGKGPEVIGKTFSDALPELSNQPFNQLLDDVFTSGIPYHGKEDRVDLVVDGRLQTFYFNFTYKPLKDKYGTVWGVLNTAMDVTEQVIARRKLEDAEEQLRMAIESADLGTWSIDANNRQTQLSARTRELFGYTDDEEMPFEASLEQICEDHRDKVITTINDAFENGGSYDIEYPIIDRQTGKQRWVRTTGRLYNGTVGQSARCSGIIMDITDRKHEEIRKNDFIAMVSHELKTPLTSIKSYIQISLLKVKKLDDDFLFGALTKADRQIVKMTRMIRSFLDLSRLESGKIVLTPERFNMLDLVKEIATDAQFINPDHFVEITHGDDAPVFADRNKIGQVLDNFLSNAFKYSPRETVIEVACRVVNNTVQVSVADKGIGVKLKDQEKLFDRYYRVENEIIKNVSGFGIGLYLAGEIIQLHNGKIWVESEEFEGAVFSFSLNLAQD